MSETDGRSGRRRFLQVVLTAPIAFAFGVKLRWLDELAAAEEVLAAASPSPDRARRAALPTPECGDDDEPTPPQTEGPFYTPRTPRRTSFLEPGIAGTPIVVSGRVFTRACRPVAGAMLDFWHADDRGRYDNEGYGLRGHQFADSEGRWRLETIVPGLYPGRTRHFHVKVQPPGGRVLITQLYFPGEPRNRTDRIFRPELLVSVKEGTGARQARFHFVLDMD